MRVRAFVKWLGIYYLFLIAGAMNIGAIGSLLKILALIPLFIWIVEKHSIKVNAMFLFSVAFVLMCTCSYIWTIDSDVTKTRIISQLTLILLIIAVSGYSYNTKEIDFLKYSLIWSSRVTAVMVLATGSHVEGRIVLDGLVEEDSNYLCAYFLFGLIAALTTLINNKKIKKRTIAAVELIVYLYIAIGTGSRGGMLAILASGLTWFLFYRERKGMDLKTILKKIATLAIIVLVVSTVSSYISLEVLDRFSATAIHESNGTGRFDLWEDAIEAFNNSSPIRRIFGYGTGTAIQITYLFPFRRHNFFHNMFIENLLELGMIGFLLYVIHIFSFIKASLKNGDYYSFSIIVGMVVLSLSTSIYVFKPYWNIMTFIICVSLRNKEKKKNYGTQCNCTSI